MNDVRQGNAILVPGTDLVTQFYFVKVSWPRCVDCGGWAIGLAIEPDQVPEHTNEVPVCAVDGFHRAASGEQLRRFEDEDLQTRSRYG